MTFGPGWPLSASESRGRLAGSKARNHSSRWATVTGCVSAVAMRPGIAAL